MSGAIRIGCSGWSYDHWKGPFYPESLAGEQELVHYAQQFSTVEVNNTFYHQPSYETVRHWLSAVGDDFLFSVKAGRYVTHMKKLKDPEDTVPGQLEVAGWFGDALGPVLFQLPPKWKENAGRLEEFLQEIPGSILCAFEFRDTSWICDDVLQTLKDHGAAFCIYHLDGYLTPREVTADYVYIRLHGPEGAYEGSYSESTLADWAEIIEEWAETGKDVYCYFDNDQNGYAPQNAATLARMATGKVT